MNGFRLLATAIALTFALSSASAQTVKWSAFPSGTQPVGADLAVGLQGGANVQWTMTQVDAYIESLNLAHLSSVATARTNLGLGTFATQNFATPPAIGATTPNSGVFTTVTTNNQLTSLGAITFSGLSLGTQVFCLGLSGTNSVVLSSGACGTGGGGGAVSSVFGRAGAVAAAANDYNFNQIAGTVAAGQLPSPTASTLGGVQSVVAVSHQWVNQITTAGVPLQSQPAFSDISGTLSLSQQGTGALNHASVIDVAGVATWKLWPDCQDTLGQHINFTQSSDSISCGTSSSGGGGAINITDGTHTVNGATSLTVGNGFAISGTTPNATLNSTVVVADQSINCSIKADNTGCTGASGGDMGQAVNLTGSGATLTLSAASPTIFAPGMTFDISSAEATGNWTIINSTGLTLRGLASTTIVPGTVGTFIANNDGTHLDFWPAQQTPTTTVLGGILSSSAGANQFANGVTTGGAVSYAQPTVGNLATISNNTIVANVSGITASPAPSSLTSILDSAMGSTQGMILVRTGSSWIALPPPLSAGTFALQITGGSGHTPFWQSTTNTGCSVNLQLDFSVACNALSYLIGVN